MAHRTTALHHVGNKYVEPDPAIGRPGTYLAAADLNSLQEELANAVVGGGLALDPADDTQLADVLAADRAARASGDAALDGRLDALEAAPSDGFAGNAWAAGGAWTAGWANDGSNTTRVWKSGRLVILHVKAQLGAGTTGTAFTLPVGYRPPQDVSGVYVDSSTGACLGFYVMADGVVRALSGSFASGITYRFTAVFPAA